MRDLPLSMILGNEQGAICFSSAGCSTLVEGLEDPIAAWLDLGLVAKLVITVLAKCRRQNSEVGAMVSKKPSY